MIIKYYTDNDLAYANRKRRRSIESYTTDLTENQKAVKLGDGATTSIITSEANLCNYVTIGDTRWYVVSYTYLNGGQVQLNLRRDVIGEFGLEGCVGKIERGYTESFLRNRKELDLNQILSYRIPLVAETNTYGNYTVSTHENEKWGILYFSNPTQLDEHGNPENKYSYKDEHGQDSNGPYVSIPKFTPKTVNYDAIEQGTEVIYDVTGNGAPIMTFNIKFRDLNPTTEWKYYRVIFVFKRRDPPPEIVTQPVISYNHYRWIIESVQIDEIEEPDNYCIINGLHSDYRGNLEGAFEKMISNYNNATGAMNDPESIFPDTYTTINKDYDGIIVHVEEVGPPAINENRLYTVTNSTYIPTPTSDNLWNGIVYNLFRYYGSYVLVSNGWEKNTFLGVIEYYRIQWLKHTYTYRVLTPEEMGNIYIDLTEDLIDEPYTIYAIPLYNVSITGIGLDSSHPNNVATKQILQIEAFNIFNTIIQYCSGENAYLVDAQIYPYCPVLTKVATSLNNYPLFAIDSTSFNTHVYVNAGAGSDVKKDYIKKEYCLISPEQSSSFKFNFYDYMNTNEDELHIIIKTALKPMNIISSAVIVPAQGSLKGTTYDSDLRGCQCSGNGFECSLSTDVFQQYVRNNSNYKAIFALQREELQKQHDVEKVNEATSTIVNTVSATAMGALAGGAMADFSYLGTSAKGVGAIIGGTVAGATVGSAMAVQTATNEQLREYEEKLQQANFDLQIGTIKNIPNQVSRISSFNEIIMKDFYYVLEIYECSMLEGEIVDSFIEKYGYGLGIIGNYEDFKNNGWFLRGTLITSNFTPILHNLAQKELNGGIYYIYE